MVKPEGISRSVLLSCANVVVSVDLGTNFDVHIFHKQDFFRSCQEFWPSIKSLHLKSNLVDPSIHPVSSHFSISFILNALLGVNHEEAVKVLTVVIDATMKAVLDPTSHSKTKEKGIKDNLKIDVKVDIHLEANDHFQTLVEDIVKAKMNEMVEFNNAAQSPPQPSPAMRTDTPAASPASTHQRDEDMNTSTSTVDSDSEINEAAQFPPQPNSASQTDTSAALLPLLTIETRI